MSFDSGSSSTAGIRMKVLGARTFVAETEAATAAVSEFGVAAETAGGRAGRASKTFGLLGGVLGAMRRTALFAGLGLGILGVKAVKTGIQFDDTLQQSRIALTQLTHSSQTAGMMINHALDLATKHAAALTFKDLVVGERRLKAYGLGAKETMQLTTQLNDTIASLGGNAPEELQRAVLAFGEIHQFGKIYQRQLLQLDRLGIPASDILRQQLGLSQQAMANVGKIGIDSQTAIAALMKGMNEQYKGAADRFAQSWRGQIIATQHYLQIFLGEAFKPLFNWGQYTFLPWVALMSRVFGDAFQDNGFIGMAGELDILTSAQGKVTNAARFLEKMLHDTWSIITTQLIPALEAYKGLLMLVVGAIYTLGRLLHWFNGLGKTGKNILIALIGAYLLWNTALKITNIFLGVRGMIRWMKIAIGLKETEAEVTAAQTLVQWAYNGALAVGNGLLAAMRYAVVLLNAAFLASPIGWIIVGVVALGVAVYLLYTRWKPFHDVVNSTFNWIKNNWPLLTAILLAPFTMGISLIIQQWGRIWNFIQQVPTMAKQYAAHMWDWVVTSFEDAINRVIKKWNDLSFTTPNVPGTRFGGVKVSTPDIPYLASGTPGVTMAGTAVVGERGPELVHLPAGAKVQPVGVGFRTAARPMASRTADSILNTDVGTALQEPKVFQVVLDRKVVAEAVYQHNKKVTARG